MIARLGNLRRWLSGGWRNSGAGCGTCTAGSQLGLQARNLLITRLHLALQLLHLHAQLGQTLLQLQGLGNLAGQLLLNAGLLLCQQLGSRVKWLLDAAGRRRLRLHGCRAGHLGNSLRKGRRRTPGQAVWQQQTRPGTQAVAVAIDKGLRIERIQIVHQRRC